MLTCKNNISLAYTYKSSKISAHPKEFSKNSSPSRTRNIRNYPSKRNLVYNCVPTMAESLKFFAFCFLTIGIVNCHVLNYVNVSKDGIGTTSKSPNDYRQKIASETDGLRATGATPDRDVVRGKNLHLDNHFKNSRKSLVLPEGPEFERPLKKKHGEDSVWYFLKAELSSKHSRKTRSTTQLELGRRPCYFKLCSI
ncbi:uncharacterized protein [Venturia canescens]|uniref:uncharacterized protein n=1 Tax=Venturia canescens TaxID=32260 RepID=UPI001C9D1DF5|nr:uncharacterized protein LOC122414256 [Venturia canescens]